MASSAETTLDQSAALPPPRARPIAEYYPPASSVDRNRSLVAVSQKWEYSGMLPETFSVCVPQGAKFGARRPIASSQKPTVGGHFYDNQGLCL